VEATGTPTVALAKLTYEPTGKSQELSPNEKVLQGAANRTRNGSGTGVGARAALIDGKENKQMRIQMTKLILAVFGAVMLAAQAFAQDTCDPTFVPRPDLPRDCVEVEAVPGNLMVYQCVSMIRGVDRPNWPDAVEVAAYVRTDEGVLHFLGWMWLRVDEVNRMHQPEVTRL
jgi:hypothetical protein